MEGFRPVSGVFSFCLYDFGESWWRGAAYTTGSDHLVLRNSSVQLTTSKGRITSLMDV
ncbi:hypothetical protein C8R44DRAFT_796454 [Mycena epipterygia]|nr:hypothetical protein C8R44DRAFT_796454 [Mycena epipterygia]